MVLPLRSVSLKDIDIEGLIKNVYRYPPHHSEHPISSGDGEGGSKSGQSDIKIMNLE